ncbi:MAG: DUF2142 domain-containing protein [Eubacteriales bacterium]|nr:DUF2142 domain-containing protein [Eubacteriales bacterium]
MHKQMTAGQMDNEKGTKAMKNWQKGIICFVVMVLLSLGVETLICNFHPILAGDSADIYYDVNTGESNEEITFVQEEKAIGIHFSEPHYIKKLYITIPAEQAQKYFMNVYYETTFGAAEEERLVDIYYPEIGVGVTNINRKVTGIRFTYTGGDTVTITEMRMTTKTDFNLYRIVLFIMFQAFVLVLVKGNHIFLKKPERLAATLILYMGSFIICCQGINENGWDEQVHFKYAYNFSYLDTIQKTPTYDKLVERLPQEYYNTKEEKEIATAYLNAKQWEITDSPKEVRLSIQSVGYLIQAAAIFLGRKLGLAFNYVYMLGKFANLLTYACLMYWVIKLIPYRKWEVAALTLVPTQIFVASSYTYDVMVNGFLFLGFAIWMKILVEEKNCCTPFYILMSILSFGIGSLSKAVYIPAVLLCLFIPKEKFPSRKAYRIFWGGIIVVFVAAMCSFVIPVVTATLRNAVGQLSDSRIEGSDQVLQMQVLFQNIPEYLAMLVHDLVKSSGELITGHTALVNFGRLGELDNSFYFITGLWFAAIMLGYRNGERVVLQKKIKMLLAGVSVIILALVGTSMYLAATSVGAESISGIQGRYYYPLMIPLMYLLTNGKVCINLKSGVYHKFILGIPILLLFMGIYGNMLQNWCF